MKGISSDRLRVSIIWLPILKADNRENAVNASQEFQDSRLHHYWSSEKTFGDMFGAPINLDQLVWDVYFVYESGVVWNDSVPSVPVFWMHQLSDLESNAPTLDSTGLRNKIQELLE